MELLMFSGTDYFSFSLQRTPANLSGQPVRGRHLPSGKEPISWVWKLFFKKLLRSQELNPVCKRKGFFRT